MKFRSFCLLVAVMPVAIFASNAFTDEIKGNLVSTNSNELLEAEDSQRNAVKVGSKELNSAEALEFLSNLANNGSTKTGPDAPLIPKGPEDVDESGLLLPPKGNNKENLGPVIPAEEKLPLPAGTVDPKQPEQPLPGTIQNPNPSGRMRCQDERSKLFIPTARACGDVRGPKVCETLFAPPDETTGRRDPKCDQPGFEDIAKSCRKQCAICCEEMAYACEDDDSGLIDCQKNKGKCTVSKWFDAMSKYCAGTCGLCTKTTCKDNNLDCRTMKAVCKNPQHKATMQSQCPRTCGFCIPGVTGNPTVVEEPGTAPAPSPISGTNNNNGGGVTTSCADVAKNCSERANLCKHPLYMEYMNKLCPKTCGTCGAQVPLATACADTHPRCQSWVATGFCSSKYYTTDYKKRNCGKSCKLC